MRELLKSAEFPVALVEKHWARTPRSRWMLSTHHADPQIQNTARGMCKLVLQLEEEEKDHSPLDRSPAFPGPVLTR